MSFIDNRTSDRIHCEAPVMIEVCQTNQFFDGSMFNHSQGGMYVEMDYALEPGTEIRIYLDHSKDLPSPESCHAKVIWCKEIPGAVVLYNYGMGVQYESTTHLAECKRIFRIIEGGASKNKA